MIRITLHRPQPVRPWCIALAALGVFLFVGSGCATSDRSGGVRESFQRALEADPVAAYFRPIVARVAGDPAPEGPSPEARQHYAAVIAQAESLTPADRNALHLGGHLGDVLTEKALAQWRLGRLDDALVSAAAVHESGQEATTARARALLHALEGVARLNDALEAVQAGKPFDEIYKLIAGDDGAWRRLGDARAEISRVSPPPPELLMARLAAFKVLKDARDALPANAPERSRTQEAFSRLRADAQVELKEFAFAAGTENLAEHAEVVTRWQELCGLHPPAG